jgi:hypothetical protein
MSSTITETTDDKDYFNGGCSRSNWDGVELPRQASLRLEDDDIFFHLLRSNHSHQSDDDNGRNNRRLRRFFGNVSTRQTPTSTSTSTTNERGVIIINQDQQQIEQGNKHTPVPLYVRKIEIELVQRKLPRYPSKTHHTEACFYPIASSYWSDEDEGENDNDFTEVEITEYENEHSLTEDISSEIEEVDFSNMHENDLEKMKSIHSQNIESAEQEERQRRLGAEKQYYQELESKAMERKNIVDDENIDDISPPLPPPIIIPEEELYEIKIGVVSTELKSMIFQAQMEARCRKVPKEHKIKSKPSLMEALEVARFTRLDEYTIEANGTQREKYKPLELPSATWVKGKEHVTLPKISNNPNPVQFTVFNEACALGGIKALKPKVTTNYDPFLSNKISHGDDVDVDDINQHKRIRTMYLTDMYLDREWKDEEDDTEFEQIRYDSLDDVKLPTVQSPVFKPVSQKLSDIELKEAIAQQVAEKVWERRYRLERPRAQPRIKIQCSCKYCKTPSQYQTFAYRKKWLTQQGLWKEPPHVEEEEEVCNTTDDLTSEDYLPNEDDSENKHEIIIGGGGTIGTDNVDETLAQSDIDGVSNLPESPRVPARPASMSDSKKTRVSPKRTFVGEVKKSILGLSRHSEHSTGTRTRRLRKERTPNNRMASDSKKTRVNPKKTFVGEVKSVLGISRHSEHSTGSRTRRLRKERTPNNRMTKNGMNSMRSLFGPSSHEKTNP